MTPEDVPAELLELGTGAHEQWFIDHNKNDEVMYWKSHESWTGAVLAAVLPAHRALVLESVACQPPATVVMTDAELAERDAAIRQQVRAKVAEEIRAARGPDSRFAEGWASTQDRDHAAAIALGGVR
jgi:hypothetical protein